MLACGGFVPRTMWRAPLLASTSAADFWGRRWNLLIHGLFRRTVFRPLTERGVPGWGAGAIAFALSGPAHGPISVPRSRTPITVEPARPSRARFASHGLCECVREAPRRARPGKAQATSYGIATRIEQ